MKKIFLTLCVLSAGVCGSMAQKAADKDPVMEAMVAETDRAKKELRLEGQPPVYFVSTFVCETQNAVCQAANGKLVRPLQTENPVMRYAMISMALGDEKLCSPLTSNVRSEIPSGNDMTGIRIELWKTMDRAYKGALPTYLARANRSRSYEAGLTAVERELKDFVTVPPTEFKNGEGQSKAMNKKAAEDYVVKVSKLFAPYDSVVRSSVRLAQNVAVQRVYSSEGSRMYDQTVQYSLNIDFLVLTEKNSPEVGTYSKALTSMEYLPSVEELKGEIARLVAEKQSLYHTEKLEAIELACILVEDESIPGLVWQSKIIGDNTIERSFQTENPMMYGGQGGEVIKPALMNLKGRRVMSEDITLKSLAGTTVFGVEVLEKASKIDATGMRVPDSMVVVEKGVLKNMIVARRPTTEYPTPTGHMISVYLSQPALTWGVMKMEINPEKLTSRDELYEKMIEITKQRGDRYAYVVGRGNLVKRIDVNDGSVETLNRRETWVSTPVLKSSSAIIGAADDMVVLRGLGMHAPTMIAPSAILFDEVDLKPQEQSANYINTSQRPIVARPN